MASSSSFLSAGSSTGVAEIVCNACGFEASFVPEGMVPCERCQKVHYCSVHCLQWDWKSGGHAKVCVDTRPVEEDSEGEDDSDDEDSAAGRAGIGGLYGLTHRQLTAGGVGGGGGGGGGGNDDHDDDEEDSLVSMDVNHLFDDSKASSVASAESSTNAPTRVTSNQQQHPPQTWEEKSKGVAPSTVSPSVSSSSACSSAPPPSQSSPTGGSGLKLGAFFESQKKQARASTTTTPSPSSPPQSSPVPNPVEDEYYEEEEEDVEEEVEIMSDSIDLASGPDNLKSIVEESEVTGDEPDLEGSWRSRDPFVAAISEYTNSPAVVEEEEHEDDMDDEDKEDDKGQDNTEEMGQDDTEEIVEEVMEEEEIIEESYDSMAEDPSSEVMEVVEDDEFAIDESTTAVQEPDSDAFREMKALSYGEASASRSMMSGTQEECGDNSSSSSNGVGALMDEFGYDSNQDGDSSESTGSLEAEASGDTTRTDDTSRLAAQPAHESDPTQMRRLMDDDSTEDDDGYLLFAGAVRPPKLIMPSEIGSLYTITSHHDSSNCTITTDDQSSVPAGQGSKEPSSSGASAGQISGEKPFATAVVLSPTPNEPKVQPKSPRFGDSDETPAPVNPQRTPASTVMNRRGSAPMSLSSDVSGRASTTVLPAIDVAQRRHSGPRSPSSLLDFRKLYSNCDDDKSASVVKDHTQALKDFRLAYQADSTPSTTPASTAPTTSPQTIFPPPKSPVTTAVRVTSLLTGVAPSESPTMDSKPSGQNNTLTVSINKALRDYETLYGTDAAHSVVQQLARGAERDETVEASKIVGSMGDALLGNTASAVSFAEPVVVATARIQETGEDFPSGISNSLSRESNPNTPPVATNAPTAQAPPSVQSAEQEVERSSNAARPRYLAYRNLLSRGAAASAEKPAGRASAVASAASSGSTATNQEVSAQAVATQQDASADSRTLENGDTVIAAPFEQSPLSNNERDVEVIGPVVQNGPSSNYDTTGLSQGDQPVETPRYLAYRTQLASNTSKSSGLAYDEQMDAARAGPGHPVDVSVDFRHDVDIHFSPTPEAQPRSAGDDKISFAPATSATADADVGTTPSSTSVSRYQNYRSHLAATAAIAAVPDQNSDQISGSKGKDEDNADASGAGSTVDSGGSVPRYLSYRESIARRVAPSAAMGATQTAATVGSPASDDDVDEVEQRLSSYLHKGMMGAAAACTATATAAEPDRTTGIPETHEVQRPAAQPPANRFTPEPLRSRRAAAALAMAQEAQRQRSQLKPVNEHSNPLYKARKPALLPPAMNDERDLESGESFEANSAPLEHGQQPVEPLPDQGSRQNGSVIEDKQAGQQSTGRSRRFLITLVVVLLVVIALVVGLSVGLTNKYRETAALPSDVTGNATAPSPSPVRGGTSSPTINRSAESVAPVDRPTGAPSKSATASPTGAATQDLLDFLSGVSFDGGASIQEAGSPQNEAFTWLSSSPDLALFSDDRKLQRYSLATLYYSAGGDNWRNNDGWLSDENECDWFSRSAAVCDNLGYYTDLSLGFNDLQGTVPAEMALLSQLKSVSLSGSKDGKLTGTVPKEFSSLSSLTFFSIPDNGFKGQLSDVVEGWPLLEYFDVGSNLFTGTFPQNLTQQAELREIDLSANRFEGSIPDIGSLTNLERFTLSDNRFSGAFDGALNGLTSLRYLNLQMNQLTSLPNSIGLLTSLEVFEAYENNVTGEIFQILDGLTRLQVLDLHKNQFSGGIPRGIGSLSSLRTLDFSTNNLDGEIPTNLGLLGNLITLFLQSNQLSGVLPTELSGLRRLSQIRIDDNSLTGEVPEEVCAVFSQTLPTFSLDCGGGDPQITCPPGMCCTYCCEEDKQTNASVCQCLYEGTGFEFLCK